LATYSGTMTTISGVLDVLEKRGVEFIENGGEFFREFVTKNKPQARVRALGVVRRLLP
jgi:hypothetical protein